jgi:3D (Asp-Asp-Asp) domain-containing protein
MRELVIVVGCALLLACQSFGAERSVLARVTVYWHREAASGDYAAWNGTPLREGHCAVDPKKIPYGSKVVFPDAECVAVDSGPAVISRKAARLCGRQGIERKAIVIDRFFDTKQKAIAWAKVHPHFMTVRILTPDSNEGAKLGVSKDPRSSFTIIANSAKADWEGRSNDFYRRLNTDWTAPTFPSPNLFLQYAKRRT